MKRREKGIEMVVHTWLKVKSSTGRVERRSSLGKEPNQSSFWVTSHPSIICYFLLDYRIKDEILASFEKLQSLLSNFTA